MNKNLRAVRGTLKRKLRPSNASRKRQWTEIFMQISHVNITIWPRFRTSFEIFISNAHKSSGNKYFPPPHWKICIFYDRAPFDRNSIPIEHKRLSRYAPGRVTSNALWRRNADCIA